MAYDVPRLRQLLDEEGLRYYLIPDREGVLVNFRGENALFQVLVLLEEEGTFLQFRSVEYLYCPVGHENLEATLRVLGQLNYQMRLLKFGWDPTDGEIAVYADLWIMDAEITQEQFSRMAHAYISVMDDEYASIKAAIESGIGAESPGSGDDSEDEESIDSL